MKNYYSGNETHISITLTQKSRYGIMIFGGANGDSFFGAIDIEESGANMCYAFSGDQLKEITVLNSGVIITLDGLQKWGMYTVISPYEIL